MQFGYIRVSSKEQNEDRQVEALIEGGIEPANILTDKASGATRERPALTELLGKLRGGDEVLVVSMDRLARSLVDLHAIVKEVTDKGGTLTFIKEGQTFGGGEASPMAALMLGVLGSVAEFERAIIRQRQSEGIAVAKARGAFKGGKNRIDRDRVKQLLASGLNKSQIARKMGIGRVSVIRIVKELEASAKDKTAPKTAPDQPKQVDLEELIDRFDRLYPHDSA